MSPETVRISISSLSGCHPAQACWARPGASGSAPSVAGLRQDLGAVGALETAAAAHAGDGIDDETDPLHGAVT